MHFRNLVPLLLMAGIDATPTTSPDITTTSLEDRAAGKWSAHAKYYALGGNVGNEIYISGTWSDPVKSPGRDSGPCTARIGGLSDEDPFQVDCSCQITGSGPLRFTSTCFLDFSVAEPKQWEAGFSVAFECTAFNSCTGSNAYSVSSAGSKCTNSEGTPCSGFRVTP
ncbi:hypothetical protein Forpe1208_v016789 [Fusarium oxysporum f. sp. rapae]|uniref:Uncharacterized protein n=1 Tax=Fusarium oxysporum f. sp. rapae TaxID=485398 RepID=A0A8J5NFK8_FUSOX|nr:hypothetical protein Forpe1208_v016789 [Fusarium oxysporum f. sp. rapae]